MSFERRVTLASAAAVAIAVVLASATTYVLVRNRLHHHINQSLTTLAGAFTDAAQSIDHPHGASSYTALLRRFPVHAGDPTNVAQLVTAGGATFTVPRGQSLNMAQDALAVVTDLASAGSGHFAFDATAQGEPFRVLAEGVAPGFAIVVTHSLAEADSTLGESGSVVRGSVEVTLARGPCLGQTLTRLLVADRLEEAGDRRAAEPVATDLQPTATQRAAVRHDDAPSPAAR